jgi:hypothetical protein
MKKAIGLAIGLGLAVAAISSLAHAQMAPQAKLVSALQHGSHPTPPPHGHHESGHEHR